MSEIITGHIETPAGTLHTPPPGAMCDKHPFDYATHRVQGETDAVSAVLHDMCEFCYRHHLMQEPEPVVELCDWCSNPSAHLSDYRDLRQGLLGPIDKVCPDCIREDQESIIDDVPSEYDGIHVRNADDDLNDDNTYFHNEDH